MKHKNTKVNHIIMKYDWQNKARKRLHVCKAHIYGLQLCKRYGSGEAV
jgi:hypothetical protein